jgi:hypothetical protein
VLVCGFWLIYRPADMERLLCICAVLVGSWFATSCDKDGRPPGQAGSDSPFVGGPCMENTECEFGLCQEASELPGNACTISCGSSQNCSSGSSCVRLSVGWVCLVDCTSDADCRTQYECRPVAEAPPPAPESCTSDADCAEGRCQLGGDATEGECSCTSDEECKPGSVCAFNSCSRAVPVCIGATSE